MTDMQALLHAIRSHPEEDMPRLLYTDWLEERAASDNSNLARAEFIRLQCQAARMSPDDPELPSVQARIASYEPYRTAWLHALIEMGWVGWEDLEFKRGFLTGLVVPAQHFDFNEIGLQFLMWEPVEQMSLGGPPEAVLKALHTLTVGLISKLYVIFQTSEPVTAGVGDPGIESIAEVRRRFPTEDIGLSPLRHLAFSNSGLTDRSANTLATSPAFDALEYLSILDSFLTTDGLRRLGEASFASRLSSLTVHGREWFYSETDGGREVARVLGSGRFAGLKYLRVKGHPLGSAGLVQLSKSPLARQLETFQVGQDMAIRGKGLAALFDREKWPALRDLMLLPVGAEAAELAPLMSSDRFATLRTFHLYADGATPDTAARLAANPHVAAVEWLGFFGRSIGDEGVSTLLQSPHLRGLKRFEISGPDLSEETLMRLADPAVLPMVHTLTITGVRAVSAGAEAALRARYGDRLSLVLYENIQTVG